MAEVNPSTSLCKGNIRKELEWRSTGGREMRPKILGVLVVYWYLACRLREGKAQAV